jgi:N-acetylglutamate synthase-like GNAT family acetyltransferase
MLLRKAAKEDLSGLKNVIKKIQEEIHRRKGEVLNDH